MYPDPTQYPSKPLIEPTQAAHFNPYEHTSPYYGPLPPIPPPPPTHKSHKGLIITLVSIICLLIASLVGALYVAIHSTAQQSPQTAIATTPRIASKTAMPTSIVTQPASTLTAPIVTPAVKPLFSDNFQNNASGWNLTGSPGQYSVTVSGGQMVLEDDHNKLLWEILPGQTFADFRLDVDAKLTKGDHNNGYGVFIRGIASQGVDIGLYYRFELYGDGTFAVFKGSLDANGNTTSTQITDYTANAAIQKEGTTNHITVIAKGISTQFLVNGVSVYTYTDSAYKGGEIALFVSNLPNLAPVAQASFTHLAVFPAS